MNFFKKIGNELNFRMVLINREANHSFCTDYSSLSKQFSFTALNYLRSIISPCGNQSIDLL